MNNPIPLCPATDRKLRSMVDYKRGNTLLICTRSVVCSKHTLRPVGEGSEVRCETNEGRGKGGGEAEGRENIGGRTEWEKERLTNIPAVQSA